MANIRERTITEGNARQEIVLKSRKNTMAGGGDRMYTVEDVKSGARFGDPYIDKQEAERAFERIAGQIKSGMQLEQRSNDTAPWMPSDDRDSGFPGF